MIRTVERPRTKLLATSKTNGHLVMDYEAYLTWCPEEAHTEWIPIDNNGKGEVIVQMPPKRRHQNTSGFLQTILKFFADAYGLGDILAAPFEMKLGPGQSSREPDILFVSTDNLGQLTEEKLLGAADLVVEIVSNSSVKRDKEDKFKEYQAAGVREYWVIDNRQHKNEAHFYQLNTQGLYQEVVVGKEGLYHSAVLPGFWLRVAWLWEHRPNTAQAIQEIMGFTGMTMSHP